MKIARIEKNIHSGEGSGILDSDVICNCGTFCNKRICPCYNVLCADEICQSGEGCEYRDCLDDCDCKCCG